MFSVDKKIIIVFNGEIYNYKEIQQELINFGHLFYSHSDTEVIIAAYQQWGNDCFNKFNGMFAIAIFDQSKEKLILARDHAGIKPLYFSINSNALYFGSEVKTFKTINANWTENNDWRTWFLLFGYIPEPITTLENVFSLAKGSYMVIDVRTLQHQTQPFFTTTYNYTIHSEIASRTAY